MMTDYDFPDILLQSIDEMDAVYKNSLATVSILLDRIAGRKWRSDFISVSLIVFGSIFDEEELVITV